MSGLIADSRTMIDRARVEAQVDMFNISRYPHCCVVFRCVTHVPVKYLPSNALLLFSWCSTILSLKTLSKATLLCNFCTELNTGFHSVEICFF